MSMPPRAAARAMNPADSLDSDNPARTFLSLLQSGDPSFVSAQVTRDRESRELVATAELCALACTSVVRAIAFEDGAIHRPTVRAATTMLLRALDDLDAYVLLAVAGHPLQAAGVGASLWEKAQCCVLVASDSTDAGRWFADGERAESKNAFWKTRHFEAGFTRLVTQLGWSYTYERAREDYQLLCDAKHPHPALLQRLGVTEMSDAVHMVTGPVHGQGWRAMIGVHAPPILRAVMWAAIGFLESHREYSGPAVRSARADVDTAVRAVRDFSLVWNAEFVDAEADEA